MHARTQTPTQTHKHIRTREGIGQNNLNVGSCELLDVEDCGALPHPCLRRAWVKGRKLMQDGYLKMNDMYTCSSSDYFKIKCKCLASMKNVLRDIVVTLEIHTGEVVKAYCSCPAVMSGYCNHVMALLLKIASFSLEGTSNIPNDVPRRLIPLDAYGSYPDNIPCRLYHSDYHFHRPSL